MKTCPFPHAEMRPELEALPTRMQKLPLDKRGYPVPWFVQWLDKDQNATQAGQGEPEFRAMDGRKWVRAVREKLCWVCGEPLGKFLVFVIGPMCAVDRTTSEPPSHLECAQWSARNCPFLTQRETKYREDDLTKAHESNVAGIPIKRQPGVALLWKTHSFKVFKDPKGKPLIEIGPQIGVEWWSHGRSATKEEVKQSVETGLPFLMQYAKEEGDDSVAELLRRKAEVELLYPD